VNSSSVGAFVTHTILYFMDIFQETSYQNKTLSTEHKETCILQRQNY